MNGVRGKLSVMMFLQFFIWGAWFELNFGYLPSLGFNAEWQQPLILGAFNLGALVALFFSTQWADRKFAAEKFVAVSHLIGGLAILGLFLIQRPAPPSDARAAIRDVGQRLSMPVARVDQVIAMVPEQRGITLDQALEKSKELRETYESDNEVRSLVDLALKPPAPFWPFFVLMLLHSLAYVPTISITNSIAFANLKDPQKEFGLVRVWGTIGWIVASWPFIFILVDWTKVPEFGSVSFTTWLGDALGNGKTGDDFRQASRYIFLVAGLASLVLAAFSLTLPHTPPKPAGDGKEKLAWLEAAKLLKYPFVAVLFLVTFLDAAVHQSFFVWTERYLTGAVGIASNWVSPVMKIGQVAEIATMIFLGYVLKRLGWRTTMVVGILGHAARFSVFAYYPAPWAAVAINAVHGICYAFFFATVYIFVDEFFPKDVRSSAQGLFNFLILGIGPFVANFICTRLGTMYGTVQDGKPIYDFQQIFFYPLGTAGAAALLLLLFFHPPAKAAEKEEEPLLAV